MGWRNIAFSCLDDAVARISEARESLSDKMKTSEPFVEALLCAQDAITHALMECVADGVPRLCRVPKNDGTQAKEAGSQNERESWIELTKRLLTRLYPCKGCTFELATMARKDVIFGVCLPELCASCAERRMRDEGEIWIKTTDHVPVLLRPLLSEKP
jgi:hypothetical protein